MCYFIDIKKELIKLRKKTQDILAKYPDMVDRNDYIKKSHFRFLLGEYFNMDARAIEHMVELVEANSFNKNILEPPKDVVKFRTFDYALDSLRLIPDQVTKLREKIQTGYEVIPDDSLGEFNSIGAPSRSYATSSRIY